LQGGGAGARKAAIKHCLSTISGKIVIFNQLAGDVEYHGALSQYLMISHFGFRAYPILDMDGFPFENVDVSIEFSFINA
jgi:hypothetical protein